MSEIVLEPVRPASPAAAAARRRSVADIRTRIDDRPAEEQQVDAQDPW